MSVRRVAYHKTALGCKTCKKRRVKCDLGRPDCKNCIRVGRECSFRVFDPAPLSTVSRITSTYNAVALSPQLPNPSFLDELVYDGLIDSFPSFLRPQFAHLLHHFAAVTSATIMHDGMAQMAWCAAIPQLTAGHRFVLQGVLAIAALHLSQNVDVERERNHYQDMAAVQINTGLIHYREAIGNVTTDNATALFAFSINMAVFAILTATNECSGILRSIASGHQNIPQRNVAIEELVKATLKWIICFRGALVILVPCGEDIAKGPLAHILKRDWWPNRLPTSPQAIEEDQKLQKLELLWRRPGRPYEYWFDTLAMALKSLREDSALVSKLTVYTDSKNGPAVVSLIDRSAALNWVVQLSRGFVSLLEQKQPDAWIIIAHYAILPSRIGTIWWHHSLAPNLISIAALIIGKDMWKWIEWPASVVGVDLGSLQPKDVI